MTIIRVSVTCFHAGKGVEAEPHTIHTRSIWSPEGLGELQADAVRKVCAWLMQHHDGTGPPTVAGLIACAEADGGPGLHSEAVDMFESREALIAAAEQALIEYAEPQDLSAAGFRTVRDPSPVIAAAREQGFAIDLRYPHFQLKCSVCGDTTRIRGDRLSQCLRLAAAAGVNLLPLSGIR